jgi:multiple sugar transport system substrate-binding protein
LREIEEDERLLNPQIHPHNYHMFKQAMPFVKTVQDLGISQAELERLNEELILMWTQLECPAKACKRIRQTFF